MNAKVKLSECPVCGTIYDLTEGECPECGFNPNEEIYEEDYV